MRILLSAAVFLSLASAAWATIPAAPLDSDHDGLSDATEDALLTQFLPRFMISGDDCSLRPAQFDPFLDQPRVHKENGSIYAQAFPSKDHPGQVELHYYHLWRRDCGEMSHPLDAEHVSALVVRDDQDQWKALYWYAAAHEDTVCDASQITRAATVDGELHGPTVWISRGKHASFLSDLICTHGCGGDNCRAMKPLDVPDVINLGEPADAMNGATWAGSSQWPLAAKMTRTDFTEARLARVDHLPKTTIAWANPEKRPMQAAILGGNGAVTGASAGIHGAGVALDATGTALDASSTNTGTALGTASARTGTGLAKSARGVKRALGAAARSLGLTRPADPPAPPPPAHSSAPNQ